MISGGSRARLCAYCDCEQTSKGICFAIHLANERTMKVLVRMRNAGALCTMGKHLWTAAKQIDLRIFSTRTEHAYTPLFSIFFAFSSSPFPMNQSYRTPFERPFSSDGSFASCSKRAHICQSNERLVDVALRTRPLSDQQLLQMTTLKSRKM